jgi:hypothetical protein
METSSTAIHEKWKALPPKIQTEFILISSIIEALEKTQGAFFHVK